MSGRGRPLRFLAAVAVGWIGARALFLWPQTPSLTLERVAPRASAGGSAPVERTTRPAYPRPSMLPIAGASIAGLRRYSAPMPLSPLLSDQPGSLFSSPAGLPVQSAEIPSPSPPDRRLTPRTAVLEHLPAAIEGRWSASGWLVARPGSAIGALPGAGQLGGSQAGFRAAYALGEGRRIALYGRVAAPLSGPGREATIGIEWQPTIYPVRLSAEHRFGLDGIRGGPAAGVTWGVDVELPGGYRLEAHAQAGTVARERIDPYADGSARLTGVLAKPAGLPVAVGGGIWGGAQSEAARLDIGPSATLGLPLGAVNMRIKLDWRQRIAGDAAPGSGLALTLGADF